MTKYAIIVAGGTGTRMKSELPKQFIEIGGLPILMHTIKAFIDNDADIVIILVLPENQLEFWALLCEKHDFHCKMQIVIGGNTRFQSCKNGIDSISDKEAIVAIHDAVRPFAHTQLIAEGFEMAQKQQTAVPCVQSKDSVRYLGGDGQENSLLLRQNVRIVQTPQVFTKQVLDIAYSLAEKDFYTDDASVVEHAGFKINLYQGSYQNIKITTPIDLQLAEIILKNDV